MHHLFYFGCKFYKDIILEFFPRYDKEVKRNYLSISFENLTTYADKVQKLVGRLKRGKNSDRKLVWLLERGIRFAGSNYISQEQFEGEYRKKERILPHLEINKFIKNVDMVRIVPIQAPKNYTADINLRKGKISDTTLPVSVKKTDMEKDYPYLTNEVAQKVGKSTNFIANMSKELEIKDNPKFHQSVRASKSSKINRYSPAAVEYISKYLSEHPQYKPLYQQGRTKSGKHN